MKRTAATLMVLLALSTAMPAYACACEITCKPGEIYSDQEEMCIPDATS